jgi:enoyl-CoA hydratase
LTGARLDAADALYVGYATHSVTTTDLPTLRQALLDHPPATRDAATRMIAKFTTSPGQSKIAAERADIDRWFKPETVEEIFEELELTGSSRSLAILETLARCAPVSLKLALRLLITGAELTLEEDLALEYRMSQHCMEKSDFAEGIRALLIDKDQAPLWHPATLDMATDSLIQSYFEPAKGPELVFSP